jgi:hypothetical protein
MAAKIATPTFLDAAELVDKYSALTASTMRDALATFPTDHVYLVHKGMEKQQGSNPFPSATWHSWDNIIKEKKDQATETAEKFKVAKTKDVKQFDKDGKTPLLNKDGKQKVKKVKIEGEFEMKAKRLRKITTFNAAGKAALSFIVATLTHETAMAAPKINKADDSSIKDEICNIEDCDYRLAPAIFAICELYDDALIKENLPKSHGNLESKLTGAIEKIIDDSNIRHVLVSNIMKFLKIFTINLASNLWYETKEIKSKDDEDEDEEEDEDDDEKSVAGKGTTTSDKHVRQELSRASNLILQGDEKLKGEFFAGMNKFYAQLQKADLKKKKENAVKRAENKAKKEAEAAKAKAEAKDATKEESDAEEEEAPKKKKAEKAESDDEEEAPKKKGKKDDEKPTEDKEEDKPADVEPAAAPVARRRRGAPK